MKAKTRALLCLATILIALPVFAQEAAPTTPAAAPAEQPLRVERSTLESVTATVTAINHKKREVTLKGPDGKEVTFKVDKSVKRLKEVAVGDDVQLDYYVSIAGELREPTAEEMKNPFVKETDMKRAPKNRPPARIDVQAYRIVATVISLDLPTQSVTLVGPKGNAVSILAENVDNLKKLRLGDTVFVTYTEAVGVSLKKMPKAGAVSSAKE